MIFSTRSSFQMTFFSDDLGLHRLLPIEKMILFANFCVFEAALLTSNRKFKIKAKKKKQVLSLQSGLIYIFGFWNLLIYKSFEKVLQFLSVCLKFVKNCGTLFCIDLELTVYFNIAI